MKCPACQHDNRDGAKFCEECAAPFKRTCSNCGSELRPAAKFCDECATPTVQQPTRTVSDYTPAHLAERILAEQAAMEKRGAADGERKTITAMFADLKGSTALIEGLDPEDARAIIDPALQIMMDAVHRYDGYVAQALGDGIFALFGAPIAHEDHPQRALYAALRIQEEMGRYSDELRRKGSAPLQVRVGINTGEVVVRSIRKDDLHTDYVPVGHSTNIAARMEQLANPGSIVVAEQTFKLTDGYFEFKPLGDTQVKGVEAPLNVFEVLGAGPLRTKLQVSARRGLSRFVGRNSEMDQMHKALEQVKAGRGQIVGVMGEPGLGKSRLFYEFKLTSQAGCLVLEAYSVSHGKATPYLPIIELLKSYFQIKLEDDERTRRAKVMGQVLSLDRGLEDTLPYLLGMLGIPDPTTNFEQMDPRIRRQRSFDSLKRLFGRESLNQPVMVIFEDLHWIDGETQEFLDALGEGIASARIALLVNYRPEYRHEWGGKTYYTQLRLTPLGAQEAADLLSYLMGEDSSLQPLKALILERTDGTPFFMEEVVQTLVEEGVLLGERGQYRVEKIPYELHISPNVQGILAARIDRLEPDEKALLQQLAVIGRGFPLGLVREVVTQSEDELYRLLSSLQGKEFLYEQPALAEVEYIFKHALTQDVAYGTVLQEQRKILHERTARAVEALRYSNLEDHYGELAHHYTKGGNIEKAIEYLRLAGQQAMQRSAVAEAINHLSGALELLESRDDTPERAEQELVIQMVLGTSHMLTKGYGAPEAGLAYSRANELCRQLDDRSEVIDVLIGLWGFHLNGHSQVKTARDIAERLLRLARAQNDSTTLVKAHQVMSVCVFYQGDLSAAHDHIGKVLGLYDPALHHEAMSILGLDFGVVANCYDAMALWLLGYPEQAAASSTAAVALAEELAHPNTSAWSLVFQAMVYRWRGEPERAIEHAATAVKLSQEHGLSPSMGAWGTIVQVAAQAPLGHDESRLLAAGDAMVILRDSGLGGFIPYHLSAMAEMYCKAGRADDAVTVLDEGFEITERRDERWCEAELYRLKGEMALLSDGTRTDSIARREVEACFESALKSARAQGAKSWELRTAVSLARLWQEEGKKSEARDLLSEIYSWFTEGFDTKDLQDAKALLEELA
ncbi:MAG: class 3 adenylate cyclase/tetratricopeptide (TPR) repeat protein [Gammaproteobacteria bacterium]|jgi:class 3 adenylate cyclase/tetratricopeptide (TPR) repeat protein